MDKDRIRQTIAYFEEFNAQMRGDIAEYEEGRRETFDIQTGERINSTKRTVNELKQRIAKNDQIIRAYRDVLDA